MRCVIGFLVHDSQPSILTVKLGFARRGRVIFWRVAGFRLMSRLLIVKTLRLYEATIRTEGRFFIPKGEALSLSGHRDRPALQW